MRDEVVNRPPKKGKRLTAERKRKAAQQLATGPALKKQRRQASSASQTNFDEFSSDQCGKRFDLASRYVINRFD